MKKEVNKKKILIVGGIVLAVAIIVAVLLFVVFAPKFSDKDILKDPSAAIAFCDKTPGAQPGCYFKIAEVLASNNEQLEAVKVCNALNDTNAREQCYGGIKSKFSTLNTDAQIAMCDAKTGIDKDNCYRGLSENFLLSNVSKSIEVCNKISEKSTKDSCLNSIIGNPEIVQSNPNLAVTVCDSLTLRSNCYNYVAQTISGTDPKQGALVCQKLSDDTQKLNCYHGAWFDFNSIVLQNYDFTISLCNVLTVKRDDCLRGASEIFMTTDKAKAEAICRLASASTVEGCLHVVQNGY